MRLAIVGSRNYVNLAELTTLVDQYIRNNGTPTVIISGGANGADRLAELYANANDIPLKIYPADWSLYGRRAGPIRNSQIVADCTCVIAFVADNSVGTVDTINKARKVNKPVMVYQISVDNV
jgi:predicted Rossmann fold nucleotide-binding protein DprA/Smf involved in DNA uptake